MTFNLQKLDICHQHNTRMTTLDLRVKVDTWNTSIMFLKRSWNCFWAHSLVDFNHGGSLLSSLGSTPDYMLSLWDWRQEEVMLAGSVLRGSTDWASAEHWKSSRRHRSVLLHWRCGPGQCWDSLYVSSEQPHLRDPRFLFRSSHRLVRLALFP